MKQNKQKTVVSYLLSGSCVFGVSYCHVHHFILKFDTRLFILWLKDGL